MQSIGHGLGCCPSISYSIELKVYQGGRLLVGLYMLHLSGMGTGKYLTLRLVLQTVADVYC
jgi:hypothetical protein